MKLSKEEILEIMLLHKSGASEEAIAALFDLSINDLKILLYTFNYEQQR